MTETGEIRKLEGELVGFIRTLELKFFKGKLHQKVVAPHTGQTPDHAWLPIESHDHDAPKPGEPVAPAAPAEETTA